MDETQLAELAAELWEKLKPLSDEQRESFLDNLSEYMCMLCGRDTSDGSKCYCALMYDE